MPTARDNLAVVAGPDGRIYAIGGQNSSGTLATVEVYDPQSNTWSTAAPLPSASSGLAGTLGPDGQIYVACGYAANGSLQNQFEVYRRGSAAQSPTLTPSPAATTRATPTPTLTPTVTRTPVKNPTPGTPRVFLPFVAS
jgi:hypothetical protein